MYTLEKLKENNHTYHSEHYLRQADVDIVNKFVNLIESSRDNSKPVIGDYFQYTDKHGTYYPHAHYENEADVMSMICWGGSCANVYKTESNSIGIGFSGSGGPWGHVEDVAIFKYVGKEMKTFWTWGSCGACAAGGLYFQAEVNVWRYDEPGQPHNGYTTEHWDRQYISYSADSNGNPKNDSMYVYFGNGIAFANETDYNAWKKTFKAVEFKGNSDTQKIVYKYREDSHLISKAEWDALDLPKDTRLCNGVNLCKVKYDDVNHIIHCYRFSNSGDMDWKRYKPYELARGRDLTQEGF